MLKKRGLVTAGLCFSASMLGWAQHTEATTAGKVTICHYSADAPKYTKLSVAASSVPGHLGHGDCVVDDGVACTGDSCDATFGCVHAPDNSKCDDGNACTSDTCDPATGCVYTPIVCNDNNACTTDTCNPASGCVYSPITCDDGDACTTDSCNPASGCVYANNNTCGDGVVCPGEQCDDGNNAACDGCSPSCTLEFCGDGVVCPPEQCDPPNGVTCDGNCQLITACPGEGDCCAAHANPGCQDQGCCEVVCAVDPYCCNAVWDDACASEAAIYCGCGPPGFCGDGLVSAPEECDDGNNNACDGCSPGCTLEFCGDGVVCPPEQCDPPDGATCDGNCQVIVVFVCPGEGDCCAPHPNPGCEDANCCEAVCAEDPFCCEVEWDEFCVDGAAFLCGCVLCPAGAQGDCCVAHANTGCDNPECCEAVCSFDSFCCDVEWDETCGSEATGQVICNCP